jgi:hypothetical protein
MRGSHDMTDGSLTHLQQHVMVDAWRHHGVDRDRHIPYGVYRSLQIRGLITYAHGHYELTEYGDHLIRELCQC